MFGTGLGGGVLAVGLSWSESPRSREIHSLASWHFASRIVGAWGTGEGEAEEVFEGVVQRWGRSFEYSHRGSDDCWWGQWNDRW